MGTSQIKKIDDNESIYSVNPLYLHTDHANKYLVFGSADENKEVLKKYANVWNGIKNKIKELKSDECDYEKDYIKIKCNSDDDFPLNKLLKLHIMTIMIRCVISEDGKLYSQLSLDDTLYELG